MSKFSKADVAIGAFLVVSAGLFFTAAQMNNEYRLKSESYDTYRQVAEANSGRLPKSARLSFDFRVRLVAAQVDEFAVKAMAKGFKVTSLPSPDGKGWLIKAQADKVEMTPDSVWRLHKELATLGEKYNLRSEGWSLLPMGA